LKNRLFKRFYSFLLIFRRLYQIDLPGLE
jgi:hypothetical protein